MSNPDEQTHLAFYYCVTGDVKFISHHDMMRLFRRAVVRAGLPVSYSQGFNPHARISAPLPRPVGMESQAELVMVWMTEPVEVGAALERLNAQLPEGIQMVRVEVLPSGRGLQPESARYRLETGPPTAEMRTSVENLIESEVVCVTRLHPKPSKARVIDIKEYLTNIEWVTDGLEFWLKVTPRGSARASEIASVLGFDARSINHKICRMEVRWQ